MAGIGIDSPDLHPIQLTSQDLTYSLQVLGGYFFLCDIFTVSTYPWDSKALLAVLLQFPNL